ncbi:MAG: ribonuclease HI [Clostridiales bacterium]|jgi:ribonuclease HI|nr:ribonuclease HI [Clostridiales bacterium]
MKAITIYTDGACSGNPGSGGWAAILQYQAHYKEISGAESDTTNNRMELLAAINALAILKEPCAVTLYTDSAYLCNAFNERWIDNWQRNGWRTSKKKPVENRDLWEQLINYMAQNRVIWKKIKGHSANKYNDRCDELARKAIKAMQKT